VDRWYSHSVCYKRKIRFKDYKPWRRRHMNYWWCTNIGYMGLKCNLNYICTYKCCCLSCNIERFSYRPLESHIKMYSEDSKQSLICNCMHLCSNYTLNFKSHKLNFRCRLDQKKLDSKSNQRMSYNHRYYYWQSKFRL